MKNLFVVSVFLLLIFSCTSSNVANEKLMESVKNNNFSFVLSEYEGRKTYSSPAGTGRIITSNVQVRSSELIGISINPDRLVINLPVDDKETSINKSSLELVSESFTVARKDLDNGNLLLNFFLNDQNKVNLVKMEINKNGRVDCSVEGPKLKPLFYLGTINSNN